MLFRADKTNARNGTRASNNYRSYPIKYFTLAKNEVNTYAKYNTTYTKTWRVTDDIHLIDILDYDTRLHLEGEFTKLSEKKALNNAFPIINTTVSRNSSNVEIDNIVLNRLCDLGYDGYYMRRLNNNGRYVFHSEVGLCSSALPKLILVGSEKKVMPKRVTKSRRANRNHNNINNKERETRKNMRFNFLPMALSF